MAKDVKDTKSGRDWSRIRLTFVGVLFSLVWLALWARAYQVQIVRGPDYSESAQRQHIATEYDRGERGQILDRNGKLLARTVQFTAVLARTKEVTDPEGVARTLEPLLGEPRASLVKKLQSRSMSVYLARQVPDKVAAQVKAAGLKGIHLETEQGRLYPNGSLAGQLLGFVGVDDRGLEGVELAMNDVLAGQKSPYLVQRDARGRRLNLDAEDREAGLGGQDVKLSIDANIQFVAEEALAKTVTRYKAASGMCLVIQVASGEIMAWAQYPFFNPNMYRTYKPAAWRNRIATDVFEPGSTLKPLLIAAALQEKVCNKDTLYYCEKGKWKVGSQYTIRDDKHHYEWLPVHKIMRYSSNIGSGKIGQALGAQRYHSYLQALGLGERTNVGLSGESKGMLRPVSTWGELDLITTSFGQGVGVTALQLSRSYLALASGGVLKPLRLFIEPVQELQPERRILSQKTAGLVLSMLQEVVEEDGTGTMARIPGLAVGGKTGTAQKAKAGGGYGDKRLSSFVGLVPAEAPEYLVMVIIDEPDEASYGGIVAAPAVREVVVKSFAYLGKLPDETAQAEDQAQVACQPGQPGQAGKSGQPGQKVQPVQPGQKAQPAQASLKQETVAAKQDGAERVCAAEPQDSAPNLIGLPLRKAMEILHGRGIVPAIQGQGLVVERQKPSAGEKLPEGGREPFTLWLGVETAQAGTQS